MMSTEESERTQRYTRELMSALRFRNVPSDRIAEVVAEVESHVAETAEDPYDAFGLPRQYAAVVADRRATAAPSTWFAIALGAAAGWMVTQSVFAVVNGDPKVHGLPTWLAVVVAVVLGVGAAFGAQRLYRPVVDPRTRASRAAGGGWPTVVVLGVCTAFVVVLAVLVRVLT